MATAGENQMKRLVYLVPLTAFLVLAGYFAIGLTKDPQKLPSMLIDKPAPQMTLPPLHEGKQGFDSANLTGGVTLVNFWASWCGPCRIEHPQLNRLAAEGVNLVGINQADPPQNAKAFLRALGDPFRAIGVDADRRAGIEWGVYGLPETFVIDKQGRIRYRHVGPITEQDLAQVIRPMLKSLN
jgi:cytochrome c biogenesis protein CcmG/thiol:disulfide interchange protein DsbE